MRMELPGSAADTAVSPPPAHNPSSGTATTESAASPSDTSPTKAWADAVAQARTNTPQPSVKAKPGDTLTGIARRHSDTLSSVEKANPRISCPNLIHPGETIYLPKKTPAQIVTGVDDSQIKPIITAMANANSADQGLRSLQNSHMRNEGLLSDAQAQSAQDWSTVEQTTFSMLTNNNGGLYPDQAAAAEVQQLNALEPGNTKFSAANDAALTEATQQWKQMGITKPQLSPIIGAYNNVKRTTDAANQYLQNPHLPHNGAIVDGLNNSEQQANAGLNAAIEKSLTNAANQAGRDPKARSLAMTERAANIQVAGPQDPAFQTAVDNANYDLQVNKPAQAIADAYAKGGASAAAHALSAATQNAGNAYYASQIIQQSQGTINSITHDMGSLASNAPRPSRAIMFGPTPGETEFNQIYTDLSRSVAASNTITTSGSLSPDGRAAADIVGNSIAANAPKNLMPWQGYPYADAATNAISDGDGAALTLATTAALKQQGNSNLASFLTEGAAEGIQNLGSQTNSDVNAFAATTNNLNKLRATWGPFLTESQLVKATNGYLADNPNVGRQADTQLGAISRDGDMVAEAEAAWHSYGAQLNGIEGQGDLATAAKSLTGKNASTAFAVSQSSTVNNAIAAALGPSMPSVSGNGSVVQALMASPVWSLPRAWRSSFNAILKWRNAQAGSANLEKPHSQAKFTTLSVVGLALTTENAIANGFPMSSPQQVASSLYTALGFPKYTGEVISGFAKGKIGQALAGRLGLSDNTLAYLSGLTKQKWFQFLGSGYYGFGALASVLEAEDDFKNGDVGGTVFNGLEALGNGLNAVKPFVPALLGEVGEDGAVTAAGELAAEAVGAFGSGIGLIAAGGMLLYEGIKAANEQQAYQNDSSKFLQQGLGLNSDVADELAAPMGGSSTSVSLGLQAYARDNRMSPGQLLQKLNQEPTGPAMQFIDEAAGMPTQSNGQYAISLPTDNPKKVGTHMVTEPGDRGYNYNVNVPYQADSLRQLQYWADYLFGKNQLG